MDWIRHCVLKRIQIMLGDADDIHLVGFDELAVFVEFVERVVGREPIHILAHHSESVDRIWMDTVSNEIIIF